MPQDKPTLADILLKMLANKSLGNPKAYDDTTAGEFLDERLREIGLK